ncbi:MAG: class I SAM-dependent methyltransferase [Anaerolineae bacterium]|nr:class I SAM-dependent methyltransferase [Anaerolineae bacterium]
MTPSDKAAQRGEPSYVWRSGQERRLQLLLQEVKLKDARILEAGCGLGMYTSQFRRRFSPYVEAFDVEWERVKEAQSEIPHALVAEGEALPYPAHFFDLVFSNEVIEHVRDDALFAREMVRVTRPGGHIALFCPNRWYPFETHGHYWKGQYHFGNTPLINYLPDRWRNQLAPHVRAYTARGLRALFQNLPVEVVHHSRIFGGYDNIVYRAPTLGKLIRGVLYPLEKTPLRWFALSHWLVLRKNDE